MNDEVVYSKYQGDVGSLRSSNMSQRSINCDKQEPNAISEQECDRSSTTAPQLLLSMKNFIDTFQLISPSKGKEIIETVKRKIEQFPKSTMDCFYDSTIAGIYQICTMNVKYPEDPPLMILHIILTNGRDCASKTTYEALQPAFKLPKNSSEPFMENHIIGIGVQPNSQEQVLLQNLCSTDPNQNRYHTPDSLNIAQILEFDTRITRARSEKSQSGSIGDLNQYLEKSYTLESRKYAVVFNLQISSNTTFQDKSQIIRIIEQFLLKIDKNAFISILILRPQIFDKIQQEGQLSQMIQQRNQFNRQSDFRSEYSFSVRISSPNQQQQPESPDKKKKEKPCLCILF